MDQTLTTKINNFKTLIQSLQISELIKNLIKIIPNENMYGMVKAMVNDGLSQEQGFIMLLQNLGIQESDINETDKQKINRYLEYFYNYIEIELEKENNIPYEEKLKNAFNNTQ